MENNTSNTKDGMWEAPNPVNGLLYGDNGYSGKEIHEIMNLMFATEDEPLKSVSEEQLAYTLDFIAPSNYTLRHHTLKGGTPFVLSVPNRDPNRALMHRPWQKQILDDQSDKLVIEKSRQLGLTEVGVAKMINFADTHNNNGVACLYSFPTNNLLQKWTKMRLDTELAYGYYGQIQDKNTDNQQVKKIRNSFITFASSSSPKSLESIAVDYLSLDEFDRVTPAAYSSAQNSLKSSKFNRLNLWSTPSVPGRGIAYEFGLTDQWYYAHKCTHCGYDNILSYEDYDPSSIQAGGNIRLVNKDGIDLMSGIITPGSYQYVCSKCGRPLDRWYNGHWICKYPSRSYQSRGYFISQMNAVWVSADDLKMAELQSKSKQAFYNYDLGFPYEDAKTKVTAADIKRNTRFKDPKEDSTDYSLCTMGIDWGNQKHSIVVMGLKSNGAMDVLNLTQVANNGATDSSQVDRDIQAIRLLFNQYNPDMVVADVGDAGNKIIDLMDVYGRNRVFGCRYSTSPTSGLITASQQIEPSFNENKRIVVVDKLVQNKRLVSLIKQGKVGFPTGKEVDKLIKHFDNVIIQDVEDKSGEYRESISRKGADHYVQSMVYCILGLDYLKNQLDAGGTFEFDVLNANNTEASVTPTKTPLREAFETKDISKLLF
jgi:hypothetical protein